MKNKILVVEDTPDMAVLVKQTFKKLYDITICPTGNDVLKTIDKNRFDIILLDLMLPDISGFELASIFKENPNTEDAFIIVISSKEDVASKITAYGLGAINYLVKPFEPRLLRSIVKSLLALKEEKKESYLEIENIRVDLLSHSVKVDNDNIKLTSSEFKILCYLIQRENEVISREKLLSISEPSKLDISDRTVDTHISSLRRKLKHAKIHIKSSYGEGYILRMANCE